MSNQRGKKSLEREQNTEQVNNIKKNKERHLQCFLQLSFPIMNYIAPKSVQITLTLLMHIFLWSTDKTCIRG